MPPRPRRPRSVRSEPSAMVTTTAVTCRPDGVGLEPLDLRVASRDRGWGAPARGLRTPSARRPCRRPGTGSRRRDRSGCSGSCAAASPFASWSSITPIGRCDGCSPSGTRSSWSCWMRGSCCTAGIRVRRRCAGRRWDPRPPCRARSRGSRPPRTTARSPGSSAATRVRCRRGGVISPKSSGRSRNSAAP